MYPQLFLQKWGQFSMELLIVTHETSLVTLGLISGDSWPGLGVTGHLE